MIAYWRRRKNAVARAAHVDREKISPASSRRLQYVQAGESLFGGSFAADVADLTMLEAERAPVAASWSHASSIPASPTSRIIADRDCEAGLDKLRN